MVRGVLAERIAVHDDVLADETMQPLQQRRFEGKNVNPIALLNFVHFVAAIETGRLFQFQDVGSSVRA